MNLFNLFNSKKAAKLAAVRKHCKATSIVLNNKNVDKKNTQLYIDMIKETL